MKTLQQILAFEQLMNVVQSVKGGVPAGIVPESMFTPTAKIIGNNGTYTKVESTRQVAQAVMYGGASKMVNTAGISKVPVTLIHSYEHIHHDPNTVALLKSTNGYEQQLGAEEVGRKIGWFIQRFVNLRRAAVYSALFTGYIYLDGNGNLLPSSSNAVTTVNFGVPAGNRTKGNALGAGDIIGTKWSDASAPIITDIGEIQQAALQLTGYPIKYAFYGAGVPQMLANNTAMSKFLQNYPAAQAAILAGGVPNGFGELTWVNASNAFYQDASGTNQVFVPAGTVVFTPDPADLGWWGFAEGTYAVPTDTGALMGDAQAALNSLRNVSGMFTYAGVSNDPVGIKHWAGDTFLPYVAVPKSIYILTVDF